MDIYLYDVSFIVAFHKVAIFSFLIHHDTPSVYKITKLIKINYIHNIKKRNNCSTRRSCLGIAL